MVSGTDAAGVVTTHAYDGRGLPTATVENARVGVPASAGVNVTTTVGYDSRGAKAQVKDPRGNTTRYARDALGRLTGETNALGKTTTTAFDGAGQRTSVTAGDGSVTAFEYTADGFVSKVAYPDKSVVSTFDALGRRVSMRDPVGTSVWAYDWAGRVTSEQDARGKTTGHVFDLVGNQVQVSYPDGRVISRVFDARGLASKQSDSSGATSFSYDAMGALVGQVRPSGVSTSVSRDLVGRVTSIVHRGRGLLSSPLTSGALNPSGGAPGNAWGHCKDNGNGHPNQAPAGCATSGLVFGYSYDPRGLVATRDVSTDGVRTSTAYTHDALGRLTASATGSLVSGYGWDAASNLVAESVSDDASTPVGGDGYTRARSVNAANQVTAVVEDPSHLPSVHTTTTAYGYDGRGNRTSEVTTRVTGRAAHVVGRVASVFDGADLLASRTDAGSSLGSVKDDSTTVWVRDGAGRALSVGVDGVTRQRTFDGLAVVSDGDTALTRDPAGGVLSEATTTTVRTGKTASTVTTAVDVLTDVLGSTVSVASAGVVSADLAVFTDFGEPLTTPRWDTVAGFTGQIDAAGLLEFAARTYDPASSTWLQDDPYRGTTARSASLNRYAYVEGAPETFVDAYGFHRAAAILQAQRLAAAQAAKAAQAEAARLLFMRTPTCTGYYGCYTTGLYPPILAGHAADYAALSALSTDARRRRLAAIQVQFADVQRQLQQEMTMSGLQEFLYLAGGGMVNWGAGMWDGNVLGSLDLLNMVFSCSDTCREPFQPTKKIGVVGDPDSFGPSYAVGEWNLVLGGLAGLGKKLLTRSAEKVAAEAATAAAARASVDALSPTIRANVDEAIQRAASGKVRFQGHDGKVYDNSDGLLPQGGNYTEWTAAQAGAKRGADRVIISGDPGNPDAIYYWDHVNPPVRIEP